jgi:hypothetical protein
MRLAMALLCVVLAVVCPVTARAQGTQTAPAQIRELPTSPRFINDGQQEYRPFFSFILPTPPPAIPEGPDAWVIEIATSGGIMGGTRRTMIDSTGSLTCPTACTARTPASSLSVVAATVKTAANSDWPVSNDAGISAVSWCSACAIGQISLWRRDADGKVRVFRAQWNQITASAVDPVVRQLAEQAMSAIRH